MYKYGIMLPPLPCKTPSRRGGSIPLGAALRLWLDSLPPLPSSVGMGVNVATIPNREREGGGSGSNSGGGEVMATNNT